MKTEFMVAITQLAAEKNLSVDLVLSAVESALVSAYKKTTFEPDQEIIVKMNPGTGGVKVYVKKTVIDKVTNPLVEIKLTEARKIDKNARVGDSVNIESTPPDAGRIAIQTARQVILQRLHEAEHHAIFEEFTVKEGEVISGVIQRVTPENIYVDIGKAEAVLPITEQVHNEHYRVGQRRKFYLLEVSKIARGPQIIVSRSHRNLLRKLLELEVPELHSGQIEIKGVAREAGHRSKVAVAARQDGTDPVGCCVGLRGIRIQNIVNELNDEKIDVVQWADDAKVFIANSLSPAQVSGVELNKTDSTAMVIVPDKQLSLAIGKDGQNARLAAKLTGWRIDIKSSSVLEKERVALATAAMEAAVAQKRTRKKAAVSETPSEPVLEPVAVGAEAKKPEKAAAEKSPVEKTVALADYDLVLTTAQSTQEKSPTAQIRFAEDILPRTGGVKKKTGKKESDIKQKGVKVTKTKDKRIKYEGEEYE